MSTSVSAAALGTLHPAGMSSSTPFASRWAACTQERFALKRWLGRGALEPF